mmetsp:Transcript_7395/g.12185  ORF Transcript_7395/g.12185 Transcript_7395/m.12185 type:complete len:220 (+) Transcript_7395:43-702(+)
MAPNSAGSSSRSSRSKLYERYDVELHATSSSNSRKSWREKWFQTDKEQQRQRQQLPPDQWTNIEMIRYICKNSSFKSKLIAILVVTILSSIIKSTLSFHNNSARRSSNNDLETKRGPVMTKYGLRPDKMDPDSHKRSNPFAAPDHQSYMEGVLEVKRVKKREKPSPLLVQNQQQQQQQQQQQPLQLEDKPTQIQGEMPPQQARKQAAGRRGKGNKMPSG